MERSGSGGVRIPGGGIIEFGDYPEGVRVEEARERVLRSWSAREKAERERRGEVKMKGEEGVGLGIRR